MGKRRTLSRITREFLSKEIVYELRHEQKKKKSSGIKFRARTFQGEKIAIARPQE